MYMSLHICQYIGVCIGFTLLVLFQVQARDYKALRGAFCTSIIYTGTCVYLYVPICNTPTL